MLSTSLSQDLYRRFLRPDASDRQMLTVGRGAAIGGGVLGIGLAVIIPTGINALAVFYGLLTVVLLVPIIEALHVGRAGAPEALTRYWPASACSSPRFPNGGGSAAGWRPETLGL